MLRIAVTALVALAVLTPSAEATFPGRNGDLLVTENTSSHAGPWGSANLLRISPTTGALTRTPICTRPATTGPATPECFGIGPPSPSPDGKSVAFAAGDIVNHDPYTTPPTISVRVLSLATGELKYVPLATRHLPYAAPVGWMPSLDFAFLATGRRVLLAGPDGSDHGLLAERATAPDIAASGRLAFVRRGNVYVLGRGGAARRLTRKGGDDPSWSPGGRFVAFTRRDSIWTVPARGGRERRVARGFSPAWSPDGRRIAFFRKIDDPRLGDEVHFLLVVNLRTGRVRRIGSELFGVPEPVLANGLAWLPVAR
jgi:Tol biopolymer transport system component